MRSNRRVEIAKYFDLLSFLGKMFHVKRRCSATLVQGNKTRSGSGRNRDERKWKRRAVESGCSSEGVVRDGIPGSVGGPSGGAVVGVEIFRPSARRAS